MYQSPAPSPSPSPGPAYLYHQQQSSNGAGTSSYNSNGANGTPSGYSSAGRFSSSGVNWVSRSHHHSHQQNASLSSLPGSLGHSSANSGNNNNAPSSPGYGSLTNNHHHHHTTHGPSGLSQIPSPGPLHAMSSASAAAAANASPHWQQQLLKAEVRCAASASSRFPICHSSSSYLADLAPVCIASSPRSSGCSCCEKRKQCCRCDPGPCQRR